MNTFNTYIICHKKGKLWFVRQYHVQCFSSAVQKSTTESTTSGNCINEKEADNTSGKTNLWKNFI